jgi:hypothetical protein
MAKWAILSSMSMESYRESGGELNLGPAEDHKVLPYVLIALVVIAAIVAAVFWLNAHKTAELTVTHEDLFAPHTVYKPVPGAGNLIGAPGAIEDDLYVVATLRMTDKLRIPLFLDGMGATMTDADAAYEATVVPARDLARLEESFPEIAKLTPKPFSLDDLQPGETLEGQVVVLLPSVSPEQWKQKKSATLTVRLLHQPPEPVALP